MREMTQEERRAFLMEGTRTGKIGVTRRDGQPYVLPVWFVLDGDDVVFTTGGDTPRGRALRRDGRARLGEDLTEMRLWARRIAARYMGEAVADRYAGRNAVPGELLVRLVPDDVVGRKGVAD